MKKAKYIIGLVLIIGGMVAIKMYKKYTRQQTYKQETKIDSQLIFEAQKSKDSIERAQKMNNKKTYLDSMQEVNRKKQQELKEIMKNLEKEK